MTLEPDHLVFIDFEACSLGPGSWPIEVGLAWIVDDAVETWSSLIRQEPYWDDSEWSAEAAQIHRIERADLDMGPNATDVAERLLDRIEARHIISDSGHDRFWAEVLFETVDLVPPRFVTIDTVISEACDGDLEIIERVGTHLQTAQRPHREGPDAARLAYVVLLAMRLQAILNGGGRFHRWQRKT